MEFSIPGDDTSYCRKNIIFARAILLHFCFCNGTKRTVQKCTAGSGIIALSIKWEFLFQYHVIIISQLNTMNKVLYKDNLNYYCSVLYYYTRRAVS